MNVQDVVLDDDDDDDDDVDEHGIYRQ